MIIYMDTPETHRQTTLLDQQMDVKRAHWASFSKWECPVTIFRLVASQVPYVAVAVIGP